MLEGWSDFFLMVGSSGTALIGLLFVVITLTTGKDRESTLTSADLYMSPIVFHLAGCFVVSAAAMAHGMPLWGFATAAILLGVLGMLLGVRILVGMRRPDAPVPHWSDPWCYGVAPLVLYAALAGAGLTVLDGRPWGIGLTGAIIVGLLLLAIRNAWDLVTWLAPDDHKEGH